MEIECGQLVSASKQPIDRTAARKDFCERLLAFDDDGCTKLLHQGGVPDELDGVAQALFSVQKDSFPAERLAVPFGRSDLANLHGCGFPPPFVFVPTARKVAASQPYSGTTKMGIGVVGFDRNDLVVTGY